MNSSKHGINTLEFEVTNIEKLGIWFLVDDREYFLNYEDYPAFKDASVAHITNVKRLSPDQFHWPDLDVDIELDALKTPENFVLRFKG